jgi:hypothetical protein
MGKLINNRELPEPEPLYGDPNDFDAGYDLFRLMKKARALVKVLDDADVIWTDSESSLAFEDLADMIKKIDGERMQPQKERKASAGKKSKGKDLAF